MAPQEQHKLKAMLEEYLRVKIDWKDQKIVETKGCMPICSVLIVFAMAESLKGSLQKEGDRPIHVSSLVYDKDRSFKGGLQKEHSKRTIGASSHVSPFPNLHL